MHTSKLRKFLALSKAERWMLVEAVLLLGLICACLKVLPFRWLRRSAGAPTQSASHGEISREQLCLARKIGWSVRVAASHVPWQAVCLPQSLVAKVMLRRRRIHATFYLGVCRRAESPAAIDSHAWVRAGSVDVTPGDIRQGLTVVAILE